MSRFAGLPVGCFLAFVLLLGGCVSYNTPGDLAFTSVSVVDWRDTQELPGPVDSPKWGRALLKIDFTSSMNISLVAEHEGQPFFHARTYFCSQPRQFWGIGWPSVYWRGVDLSWSNGNPIGSVTDGDRITYSIFLDVAEQRRLTHPPAEPFDLRRDPREVCMYVRARDMLGFGFESNTVVVPKGAIIEALRNASPIPPD